MRVDDESTKVYFLARDGRGGQRHRDIGTARGRDIRAEAAVERRRGQRVDGGEDGEDETQIGLCAR